MIVTSYRNPSYQVTVGSSVDHKAPAKKEKKSSAPAGDDDGFPSLLNLMEEDDDDENDYNIEQKSRRLSLPERPPSE